MKESAIRSALVASLAILFAAPTAAQPTVVEVHLSNFKFEPKAIELKANTDYALTLVNDGGGGHSFSAKEFFAAVKVEASSSAALSDGKIEVRGDEKRTIHFRTPAAGTYKVKCTHAFHSGFGMKGEIIVR